MICTSTWKPKVTRSHISKEILLKINAAHSRFRADVFGQHRHTDAMALGHVLAKGLEGLVAIDSDLDV